MVYAEDTSVTLSWDPPTERVNGEALDPATDIASYELRCSLVGEAEYTAQLSIPGLSEIGAFSSPLATVFPTYGLYDCEMAAVDTFGIYSDYVIVQNGPVEWLPGKPQGPTNLLILIGNG
jgi:hypothetical protein